MNGNLVIHLILKTIINIKTNYKYRPKKIKKVSILEKYEVYIEKKNWKDVL